MPLATVAVALALAEGGDVALRWAPKEGETQVYEFFLKEKDTSVEAVLEHKVTGVRPDGSYTVRSRSLGAIVRAQGSEFRDERENESSAVFDARGTLVEIKGGTDGLEKYRHALLTSFVSPPAPVAVGGTWRVERPAEKPKGLSACTIDYRLVAVKGGAAEVAFTFAEKGGAFPQTASGTWTVDAATGLPMKLTAKVKNFVGQESGETEVTLNLRRRA